MSAENRKNKIYELAYLSDEFYRAYPKPPYDEILTKGTRPYAVFLVEINGTKFALPFRSTINHPHCFKTSKSKPCGIDYSKAVAILKPEYVDRSRKAQIDNKEYSALKGKDNIVKNGFLKYIEDYKKAKNATHIPRNASLIGKSALQYFEKYL